MYVIPDRSIDKKKPEYSFIPPATNNLPFPAPLPTNTMPTVTQESRARGLVVKGVEIKRSLLDKEMTYTPSDRDYDAAVSKTGKMFGYLSAELFIVEHLCENVVYCEFVSDFINLAISEFDTFLVPYDSQEEVINILLEYIKDTY